MQAAGLEVVPHEIGVGACRLRRAPQELCAATSFSSCSLSFHIALRFRRWRLRARARLEQSGAQHWLPALTRRQNKVSDVEASPLLCATPQPVWMHDGGRPVATVAHSLSLACRQLLCNHVRHKLSWVLLYRAPVSQHEVGEVAVAGSDAVAQDADALKAATEETPACCRDATQTA